MADEDVRASDDANDEGKGARADKKDDAGSGPGRDRELATAIKRRDDAIESKRKAEAALAERDERIKELESYKAKFEELEGVNGKNAGVLARKDDAIAKAQAKIKELEGELGGLHRTYRHRDFVDKLTAETKVSPVIIKGLLHVLKSENPNFDDAPQDPSDKQHLKTTIQLLQELEPTPFTPPEKEKPRARPGPSSTDYMRTLPSTERPASSRLDEIKERAANKNRRPGETRR